MDDFKVLTLNSWGMMFLSKDLDARMIAISNELAKGHYDLVTLQEVWSLRYYDMLCEKVKHVLPYSHYFHSGFTGSGCATFSRYPIVDTFFHKYSHNGYFWDVLHCDWFGGKGIGCVIINHPKKKIYSFNTHLHADYHGNSDNGLDECRTLQSYQLSQVVRQTTRPGDAIIVSGDLNHTPDSLGIKALLELAKLNDTYDVASTKPKECYTMNPKFNKYADIADDVISRIDYILSSNVFECTSCNLAMQKIPNTDLHFSDHEGYTVNLKIKESVVDKPLEYNGGPASQNILKQLHTAVTKGEKICNEIHWKKVWFLLVLFIMLIILPVLSIDVFHLVFPMNTTWLGKGVFMLQIVSVVLCVIYLWVNTIIRFTDVKTFRSIASEIKIRLCALDAMNDKKVK